MSAPVTWASVYSLAKTTNFKNPLYNTLEAIFNEKIKQSDSHQPICSDDVFCYLAKRVTVVLIGAHWTILPKLFFSSTNWQILPIASPSRDELLQNDPSGLVHDLCGCVTVQFMCCAFVRDGLRGWEQGILCCSAAHSLFTMGNISAEELLRNPVFVEMRNWRELEHIRVLHCLPLVLLK